MAMGYADNKAKQKARHQGNNLRNNAMRSVDKIKEFPGFAIPKIINWTDDVESQSTYQQELKRLNELYHQNSTFQRLVRNETLSVIRDRVEGDEWIEAKIDEGILYVLEELAWLTICPPILGFPRIAYVYHQKWFLDEFIAGKYDGRKKQNLGFVIIR